MLKFISKMRCKLSSLLPLMSQFKPRLYSTMVPKTMRAAVLHSHSSNFCIENIPTPQPNSNQVLVKMHSSGVCHTDIHTVDADWPIKSQIPTICGHEGVGEVVKIGENVSNISIGDIVGIPWLHESCGLCEFCVSGNETVCESMECTGYTVNGCFSEYVLGSSKYVVAIPDNLSYEQAAPILCAGVTMYKGLKSTQCKVNDYISIIGAAGGLGHVAIQYAKSMGFNVIAIDIGDDKRKFCKDIGADYAFDGNDENIIDLINDASGGGCHGVLVSATELNAFKNVMQFTRNNGRIVFVGIPAGSVPIDVFGMIFHGISIHGSIVGTRQDLKEALDIAANKDIKCNVETYGLDDINNVFDKVRTGKVNGRIVINF